MDANQYKSELSKLLPPGKAFAPVDSVMSTLLEGMAEELARLDGRAQNLVNEADPRTAYELLEDWERVCGLPDDCTGEAATIEDRRQRVVLQLIMGGGQSIAYLEDIAAALGYDVEIVEYETARIGSALVGDPLYDDPWMHAFGVIAEENTPRFALIGSAVAGDRLAEYGDEALECIFQRIKPAHSAVLHIYI